MNKLSKISDLKISVLIPAHGTCEFLLEAVNSVLSQDFPGDFEILIIAQNISLSVLEGIQSIEAPQMRVVDDPGSGIVSALNLGLKLSKYPWIARLDSDDLMAKNRIKHQAQAIQEFKDLSIVGGQAIGINSNGLELGQIRYPRSNLAIRYSLKYMCPLAHPAILMKKSVVLAAGGYSFETDLVEDYDLWCRLNSNKVKFMNISEVVLFYRMHTNQITRQDSQDHLEKVSKVIFRNLRPYSESTKEELAALGRASQHLSRKDIMKAVIDIDRDWKIRKLVYRYIFGKVICKVIYMSRL
jgi:glycosyltransferase involved in cell wall biosynthesis